MSKITATRYHDFSYGHRVVNQGGKCEHLHGHNGRVHFTVQENVVSNCASTGLDAVGRVIDFSAIKQHLCMWLEDNWDHKFLVWSDDPLKSYLAECDPRGVVQVPFNPTAENMAQHLVEVVGPQVLPGFVKLVSVTFEETAKCSATYSKD